MHSIQKLMFYVSDIITTPPEEFFSPLEAKIFEAFSALGIPFQRVESDPGITMEDCKAIGEGLGESIVKTVFLCNRQETAFYLYVTRDDKPFVTREFCSELGIPRVSFASPDRLEELTGVKVGATTILSCILPECGAVKLVMDKEIADREYFACTDGRATCFVKIRTADLLEKFIPHSGHSLSII